MSSGQSRLSSGSHVFSALLHREGTSLNHFTHTFANLEAHRLTHSVKPFHFRKYSALPFTTRRRMILSTANSWTTAVSSVFLCLAVCFFLILPSLTSTRMVVREHRHSATFRHIKRDTGATITRVFGLFVFFLARMSAGTTAQEGSHTMIRALIPAPPPDVYTLLTVLSIHTYSRVSMRVRAQSQFRRASCANNRRKT